MIKSLSLKQKRLLPTYKEKWEKVLLKVEEPNYTEVEESLRILYRLSEMKAPKKILWVDGPEEARKVTKTEARRWKRDSQLVTCYEDIFEDISFSLAERASTLVWETLGSPLEFFQSITKYYSYHDILLCLEDIPAFAQLDYISNIPGLKNLVPTGYVEALYRLASYCSILFPYKNTAILVKKPELIRFEEGRLHSAVGPAFKFRDGFEGYYWKGTEVPKEWIVNSKDIDPAIALHWDNVEQRRCAAEIIGWKRVLELLNPRTVDEDKDPVVGTLLEVKLEGQKERFLQVLCGTGRTFCIPVPRKVKTAQEAQNWIWQWDSKLPKPEIRT